MTLNTSPARMAAPNHVHMPHSAPDFATTTAAAGCDAGSAVATGAVVGAVVAPDACCVVAAGLYAANSSGLFGSTFVPAGAICVATVNVGLRGGRQTESSQIWY